MSKQVRDAALVDTVLGYCAKHDIEVNSLDKLTFGTVVEMLAELCRTDPIWVYASEEVRRYYPICHHGCHIKRVQAFVQNDCGWSSHTGPNQPAGQTEIPDNVVEMRPKNTPLH
jgi:hypothetical protein